MKSVGMDFAAMNFLRVKYFLGETILVLARYQS